VREVLFSVMDCSEPDCRTIVRLFLGPPSYSLTRKALNILRYEMISCCIVFRVLNYVVYIVHTSFTPHYVDRKLQ
jgi:hypothetical protein